jgi:alpha-L-fucosidase 2
MRLASVVALLALVTLSTPGAVQRPPPQRDLRLWYTHPAANWNEALPIGNGRLGAMVFGGVEQEHLQLNEDTVWAGEKRDRLNPAGPDAVKQVRRLLAEGKAVEAEALADKAIIATPRRMPPYQTLGDLTLDFAAAGNATEYERQLDLTEATTRVRYRAGRTTFTREIFASAPDQALVIRLTKSGPDPIAFSAGLTRVRDAATRAAGTDVLLMEGQALVDPSSTRFADERRTGVRFAAMVRALPEGGRAGIEGDRLIVQEANAVTLILTASTSMHGPVPADAASKALAAASAKSFPALRDAHVADYRALFDRVTLRLGTQDANGATDERLKRIAAGAADPDLVALYFQFGRYLLISSSRAGSMAANLQGIWNDSWPRRGRASTPSTSTPR